MEYSFGVEIFQKCNSLLTGFIVSGMSAILTVQ